MGKGAAPASGHPRGRRAASGSLGEGEAGGRRRGAAAAGGKKRKRSSGAEEEKDSEDSWDEEAELKRAQSAFVRKGKKADKADRKRRRQGAPRARKTLTQEERDAANAKRRAAYAAGKGARGAK